MPDRDVQKTMARVVRNCLVANSQGVPNETIFQTVQQVRADLALGLLQRLVDVKSRGSEVFGILSVAWEAAVSRHPTYESALVNNDMEYYGSLLNMIFLALQFHVAGAHRSDPEALSKKPEVSSDLSIVLEVVKAIVAQGFRSLTMYLHEEPQRCSPKDFAILTAILQTALKVKDVDRIYEQLAFHLAESDAIRYAVALFSWSHQLTVDGDPVYGELSVLYLLELSCIPMLAEQIAADGVLAKLSTYRLMEALRHPQGCGVFDAVPRLFSIWNGGLLRLCLNLLFYVSRTAPEVAAFLNQFNGQLRRASEAFSVGHAPTSTSLPASRNLLPGSQPVHGISLGMASEACSLALISAILRKFREAGPSAGVDSQSIQELKWDGAQVKDDIEVLLEKRSILRSRITPTNEQEVAWLEKRPADSSSGAQSLLEEKIVKELKAALLCIDGGEGQ
jgi:nuclear pore complex protein Nup188